MLSSAAGVVAGVEAAGSVAAGAIAEPLALGVARAFGLGGLPVAAVRAPELDGVDEPVRVARLTRGLVGVDSVELALAVRVARPLVVLAVVLVGVDPVALAAELGDGAVVDVAVASETVAADVARRSVPALALDRFEAAAPAVALVRFAPVPRRLLGPVPFALHDDFARRAGVAGGCTGEIEVIALAVAEPTSRAAPPIA